MAAGWRRAAWTQHRQSAAAPTSHPASPPAQPARQCRRSAPANASTQAHMASSAGMSGTRRSRLREGHTPRPAPQPPWQPVLGGAGGEASWEQPGRRQGVLCPLPRLSHARTAPACTACTHLDVFAHAIQHAPPHLAPRRLLRPAAAAAAIGRRQVGVWVELAVRHPAAASIRSHSAPALSAAEAAKTGQALPGVEQAAGRVAAAAACDGAALGLALLTALPSYYPVHAPGWGEAMGGLGGRWPSVRLGGGAWGNPACPIERWMNDETHERCAQP